MSDPTGIYPTSFTLLGLLRWLHDGGDGEYGVSWPEIDVALGWTPEETGVAFHALLTMGAITVSHADSRGFTFMFRDEDAG